MLAMQWDLYQSNYPKSPHRVLYTFFKANCFMLGQYAIVVLCIVWNGIPCKPQYPMIVLC